MVIESVADLLAAVVAVDPDDAVGVLGRRDDLAGVTLPDAVTTLSAPTTDEEYARVLYQSLREADDLGVDVVVTVLPPAAGLGAAVGDRLRRAAAASMPNCGCATSSPARSSTGARVRPLAPCLCRSGPGKDSRPSGPCARTSAADTTACRVPCSMSGTSGSTSPPRFC